MYPVKVVFVNFGDKMMPTTAPNGGEIPFGPCRHGGHVRPRLNQFIDSTGTVSRAARFDWNMWSRSLPRLTNGVCLRGRYLDFPTRAFWRATYMDDTYLMSVRARRADPISGRQNHWCVSCGRPARPASEQKNKKSAKRLSIIVCNR